MDTESEMKERKMHLEELGGWGKRSKYQLASMKHNVMVWKMAELISISELQVKLPST